MSHQATQGGGPIAAQHLAECPWLGRLVLLRTSSKSKTLVSRKHGPFLGSNPGSFIIKCSLILSGQDASGTTRDGGSRQAVVLARHLVVTAPHLRGPRPECFAPTLKLPILQKGRGVGLGREASSVLGFQVTQIGLRFLQ